MRLCCKYCVVKCIVAEISYEGLTNVSGRWASSGKTRIYLFFPHCKGPPVHLLLGQLFSRFKRSICLFRLLSLSILFMSELVHCVSNWSPQSSRWLNTINPLINSCTRIAFRQLSGAVTEHYYCRNFKNYFKYYSCIIPVYIW